MVPPASVDPLASNVQLPPAQVAVNEAVGTVGGTVTVFERVPPRPASSVTERFTAYVPAVAYVCCAIPVVADAAPSPKLQVYDWIVPSLSVEALPSKLQISPEQLQEKAA